MNRINPLHLGLLLIVILIFVIFKLNNAKVELLEAKESYKETLIVAKELTDLKKVYADKKKLKKTLQRILQLSSLRSAKIVKTSKKTYMILSSKSIDKKALNTLMAKILNANFNLNSLKIKRLSEKKASLYMEIKW